MTSMIRQVINIPLMTCQHKCIIYVNAVINDVRFNFLSKKLAQHISFFNMG